MSLILTLVEFKCNHKIPSQPILFNVLRKLRLLIIILSLINRNICAMLFILNL